MLEVRVPRTVFEVKESFELNQDTLREDSYTISIEGGDLRDLDLIISVLHLKHSVHDIVGDKCLDDYGSFFEWFISI
jgi:hypothetical protein